MARTGRRSRFRPTMLLRSSAISRGFLGSSRGWRTIGIAYFGIAAVRKLFGRTPEVVSVDELAPGQRMQITAIPPPDRRRRRS
ncbi:MAG: hypothetical protein M3337_08240 [Actinomycetota bacterium]|nr:hypothetical protein [Actinomycetota bacterium]